MPVDVNRRDIHHSFFNAITRKDQACNPDSGTCRFLSIRRCSIRVFGMVRSFICFFFYCVCGKEDYAGGNKHILHPPRVLHQRSSIFDTDGVFWTWFLDKAWYSSLCGCEWKVCIHWRSRKKYYGVYIYLSFRYAMQASIFLTTGKQEMQVLAAICWYTSYPNYNFLTILISNDKQYLLALFYCLGFSHSH